MLTNLQARIRANLIADLRAAHRFWSVRLSAIGAGFSTAWLALPPDIRAGLPGAQWIGLALFLSIALARIIDQSGARR
jgi:hypothetical protein